MDLEKEIKWLKDRVEIETTILKYATAADLRDWDLYKSILNDEIDVDFSSFGNGPIAVLKKEQLLEQVVRLIPGFDSTQHQLTNFVIDIAGSNANVVAYMQAEHFVNENETQYSLAVGGYYTYKLVCVNEKWKITALKLTVTWTRGDMTAFAIATKQVNS